MKYVFPLTTALLAAVHLASITMPVSSKAAGIFVILVDSLVEKGEYVSAITTDNKGAAASGTSSRRNE